MGPFFNVINHKLHPTQRVKGKIMTNDKNKSSSIKLIVEIISIVLGIIISFIFLDDYLNNKIESKISDDKFVTELSQNIRPFVIFDDTNRIIYDHGAMNYIEDIKIDINKNFNLIKIEVIFIKHFQAPPILESLGPNSFSFIPKKEPKYKWSFEPFAPGTLGFGKNRIPDQFKLEILR